MLHPFYTHSFPSLTVFRCYWSWTYAVRNNENPLISYTEVTCALGLHFYCGNFGHLACPCFVKLSCPESGVTYHNCEIKGYFTNEYPLIPGWEYGKWHKSLFQKDRWSVLNQLTWRQTSDPDREHFILQGILYSAMPLLAILVWGETTNFINTTICPLKQQNIQCMWKPQTKDFYILITLWNILLPFTS